MLKTWLDLPVTSYIENAYKHSYEYIMKCSGVNIGNLVFRKAISSLIGDYESSLPITWKEANNLDFSTESTTIISCANWLGMGDQAESSNLYRAKVVEKISGKCLVLGLGAQASHGEKLVLGPNTQRLAKALASKCKILSVRDSTTANSLEKAGVHNIEITGCPSNFINLDLKKSDYNSDHLKENCTWADINCLVSESSGGNPLSLSVINRIYSILAQSQGSSYILQSPALLPLLYRKTNQLPDLYKPANIESIQTITKLIKAKSRIFTSVDEWLFSSRFYDISFGMRIHGTMVPLQAGIPSILIAHDQRTSGLAKTMGIPQITCKEFVDKSYLRKPYELLNIFKNHVDQYIETRKDLSKKLLKVIADNGFAPSLKFSEYCK